MLTSDNFASADATPPLAPFNARGSGASRISYGAHLVTLIGSDSNLTFFARNTLLSDKENILESAFPYYSEVIQSENLGKPTFKLWKTYNFEVENQHTYIADGIRVHNLSELAAEVDKGFFDSGIPHDALDEVGESYHTAMHNIDNFTKTLPQGPISGIATGVLERFPISLHRIRRL